MTTKRAFKTEKVSDGLESRERWSYDLKGRPSRKDAERFLRALENSSIESQLAGYERFHAGINSTDPAINANAAAMPRLFDLLRTAIQDKKGRDMTECLLKLELLRLRIFVLQRIVPLAKKGKLFAGGKKNGAADPLTKAIVNHLKKHPHATAPEIWGALAAKATEDFRFETGHFGKYHERWDANGRHEVSFRTFTNKVSQQRGILKRG